MKVVKCDIFDNDYVVIAEHMTARFNSYKLDKDKETIRLFYNEGFTGVCIHLNAVDSFLEQLSKLMQERYND